MIASVLSVYLSFNETMENAEIRRAGTKADIEITNVSPAAIERIKKLNYIASVGMAYSAAFAENTWADMGFSAYVSLSYCDDTMWNDMLTPAYNDIVGAYPQKDNEVMLPRGILSAMGIETPEIGMSVSLSVQQIADGQFITEKFILSGFYTTHRGVDDAIRISKAYLDKKGDGAAGTAGILFRGNRLINELTDRLSEDLRELLGNSLYIKSSHSVNNPFGTAAVYGVVILFLMFTGFLLIYNVLTISVSNDVRFFGLLKTVGTTPGQLRSIVTGQTLRLCIVAIPLGAGLAAALSLVVVPTALKAYSSDVVTSFSPYIFLGAALFALITAITGAALPARKTSRISPVEASRYTGETLSKKRAHVSGGASPRRMALRNLFRSKRRAAIVFLSLFLGLTTFLTVGMVTGSLDAEKFASSYGDDDFFLRYLQKGFMWVNDEMPETDPQKFDAEYLQKLQKLPGLSSIWTMTQAYGDLTYSERFADCLDRYYENMAKWNDMSGLDVEGMKEFDRSHYRVTLYGITKEELAALNRRLLKPIDADAFDRGEIALIATDSPELFGLVEEFEITFKSGTVTLPFGGFIPGRYKGSFDHDAAPSLFVSQAFLARYVEAPSVSTIGLRVREDAQREAADRLNDLTGNDDEVWLQSRIERLDEVRSGRMMFWIIGGSLSGILGLIGVLNFVNVLTVGIIARRREIATLEANGMSKKQACRMLLLEGFGYAAVTLGLAAVPGNLIAIGLYRLLEGSVGADELLSFTYPLLPVILAGAAILLICAITPGLAYRSASKATLSERLREAE